jgi:hypothetical protein
MFFSQWIRPVLIAVVLTSVAAIATAADNGFHPELVDVDVTAREIRPGDPLALTLTFRNNGSKPAPADYKVFVHLEPEPNCRQIVFQADHSPDTPTSLWPTGESILDGPQLLTIPADLAPAQYHLHVGVFDPTSGLRFVDSYAGGRLTISPQARPAGELGPTRMTAEEVKRRREALAARIAPKSAATLETKDWRFSLDRRSAAWELQDKATGVLWTSDPRRPRFGEILLRNGERSAIWPIDRFDEIKVAPNRLRLSSRPLVNGQPSGATITFVIESINEPTGVRIAYSSTTTGPWQVSRVSLLDHAGLATDADDGNCYVAHRLGVERPAHKAFPGNEQWRTYDQLSMAMCGLVKQGSALLVDWDQVDTRFRVNGEWPDLPLVAGRRATSISLEIDATTGNCNLRPLGRGDYVQLADAYRQVAKAKGWLTTWAEKRKLDPSVERFYGASDFKPFVLNRLMPTSRFSPDHREHVNLSYTFDDVAACAEHWRNDLKIDRAAVVLAGWINRGYDVGHPDVLPAAPECGGDERLAEAGRRIKACGYLFGMHDNYLDMYEDAPSWSQEWLAKDAHGKPKRGGNWAGGQAWRVCAKKQVELAARPKTNLPEIARRFQPSIYFIDTVFAEDLVSCEDPSHPTDRLADLQWKTRLCQLAKKHFGLFGSEEGREWAVPCAEYLEGIFSHQTESPVGEAVPLFPLVYSDCVQLMTHQGVRIGPGDEKKVADHILFAEMPLPSFGPHRYWERATANDLDVTPLAAEVKDLGDRRFEITYRWQVARPIPWNGSFFVHFVQPDKKENSGIVFQHDHAPRLTTSEWPLGVVSDGPHTVQVPDGVDGTFEIAVGMLHNGERISLGAAPQEELRYRVGSLKIDHQKISFRSEQSAAHGELWSRGDGGWPESLGAQDRVIKNTWEALSPLNVITAERRLDSHEFLTPDRRLQRTRFGDLTITVAYDRPAQVGEHKIPAYGFIVESPGFLAFCATRYNGVDYAQPAFFTARSLDGKPIAASTKVRIYHGFGDPKIKLLGKEFNVRDEQFVNF